MFKLMLPGSRLRGISRISGRAYGTLVGLIRAAKLTKNDTLNLAHVALANPEEAQNALNVLTTGTTLSVAPHLQLCVGTLVEISAPKNPKIHERYGRVASVHENRVEVWVRDTEIMEMNKY
ncbi:MAG: hypothetical protein ACRDEA_06915, partial [Microcystaceae cyanobacterium]